MVSEHDFQFIDLPDDDVIDLLMAANYLDIRPLLDLAAARIASLLKNKTTPEIRDRFGIENDLTPEEEAAIRRETQWVEECL